MKTAASGTQATSMQDLAKMQTKSIDSSVYDKAKVTETSDTNSGQEDSSSSTDDQNTASGPKSISEIANLLKNRNIEKGDK